MYEGRWMAELEWVDLDLYTNTKFVTHPWKVASRGKCELCVLCDKAKEVKMKIFTQHIYIYEETGTQTRQSLYLMCLDHTKWRSGGIQVSLCIHCHHVEDLH